VPLRGSAAAARREAEAAGPEGFREERGDGWIPAEDPTELNANIAGRIEVVAEYRQD